MIEKIIAQVEKCLADFGDSLLSPLVVGFSGGKDSSTLLMVLKRLNINVIPVIVDMTYSSFNAKIVAQSSACEGVNPIIVNIKDDNVIRSLPITKLRKLKTNFEILQSDDLKTPCTYCTQVRRILLINQANQLGVKWVALGHHREDLLATILKDFFAYRYLMEIGKFEPKAFVDFVRKEPIDLISLRQLVTKRMASSMAIKASLGQGISLIRPLAYVSESDIEEYIAEQGIITYGSGCPHSILTTNRDTMSKREIVHRELRRRISNSPELANDLLKIAISTLTKSGSLLFNPRSKRQNILPGFD
jgi:tRNA 2-thiocytidine biosynthesis protein TtcA